jgi:hypothetical protein
MGSSQKVIKIIKLEIINIGGEKYESIINRSIFWNWKRYG